MPRSRSMGVRDEKSKAVKKKCKTLLVEKTFYSMIEFMGNNVVITY